MKKKNSKNDELNDKIFFKKKRPPIVGVAGHIDHGKTTLINKITGIKNNKEHGNITQHVKCYVANTNYGFFTFIDTPGHFAFNNLRKISIKYVDIIMLVIAMDDGIKPQTIEVIKTSKLFNIPIFVVLNKIDKVQRNEKIINELTKYDLVPEEWGGDTLFSFVSAKTNKGIDNLLHALKFQSEMLNLELKDNDPQGIVIDSKIDSKIGIVTLILLLKGVLKIGDVIKTDKNLCKIKSIIDQKNRRVDKVFPSMPVSITGFSSSVDIGEKFALLKDGVNLSKLQRTEENKDIIKLDKLNFKNYIKEKQIKKLNIIIKVDVQGSIKVLNDLIKNLSKEEVKINIIKIELGNIKKSDIELAEATKSILLGFNVKMDLKLKKYVKGQSIEVNIFNVIYDLMEYVQKKIEYNLKKSEDNILGTAKIKKIFKHEKYFVAGCVVINGKIKKNNKIKIVRKNDLIYEGSIESIKIFKKIVHEVKKDMECGISIKDFNDFQMHDKIIAIN